MFAYTKIMFSFCSIKIKVRGMPGRKRHAHRRARDVPPMPPTTTGLVFLNVKFVVLRNIIFVLWKTFFPKIQIVI